MLNSDQMSAILNQHMFLLCTFCANIIYIAQAKRQNKKPYKKMTRPYPTHLHTFISQKSTEPGEH